MKFRDFTDQTNEASLAQMRDYFTQADAPAKKQVPFKTDSNGIPPDVVMILHKVNKGTSIRRDEYEKLLKYKLELDMNKRESVELDEQVLDEVNMSPSNLRQLVSQIDARAGMEFEMIVPVSGADDDGEMEPDYDEDSRSRSFGDIEEFFNDGDYNSRRDVQRMMESIHEEFYSAVDEDMFEDWQDNMFETVRDYVVNNLEEDEAREELELEEDHELTKEDWARLAHQCIEEENEWYERAREDYEQDYRDNTDESTWLERNYPYMSDISNNFDITWPYWTTSSEGEANLEMIADEFSSAVGRKVNYSSSYHGGRRDGTSYVVEPDGSLDPDSSRDSGLEFVSPPLPVTEMLDDLKKTAEWAGRMNCYTNSSTGLHMNVSVPNFSNDKLDYVKLALLLGDEYILNQFGRATNTYTKSALKIVRDRIQDRPEDAQAMLAKMKGHLDDMASKVIHSGATQKYTSINTKDGYVEFRSPGGDWLQEYANDAGKIENTLLRFVVALDAACDPEKFRQDYLKKLYSILQPKSHNDTLAYFAQYAAGAMPKAALKSFIKQAQLERNLKKGNVGGEKFWWSVSRPGYGASIEVVASSKEEALAKAVEPGNYPDWASASNLQAKPLRPYDQSPVKATAGEPQPAGGGEFTGWWRILSPEGREIHRFNGIGNNQSDANAFAIRWLRQHPEDMRQGVEVVPEMR
jgi:hypothetical protein